MFELGVCRRCGAEYASASSRKASSLGGSTHAPPLHDRPLRLLLGDALPDDEDDEDEDVARTSGDDGALPAWLCPGCGAVSEGEPGEMRLPAAAEAVRVWIARSDRGAGRARAGASPAAAGPAAIRSTDSSRARTRRSR